MSGYDAVVVGGGIVGASVAYHLVSTGEETLLVDRHDEGRATDAGAGIVSAATSSRSNSDEWFGLATDAVAYYPTLDGRLRERGLETGYAACDLVHVAQSDADEPAFERTVSRLSERTERLGVPAPESYEEVSPTRARELCPPLADVHRALHYTGAGRVDGRQFAAALRRAGERDGLEVIRASAEDIQLDDGHVRAVETDAGTFETRAVVVAGGAWSPAFADRLGVEIPIEPMRGQIAHLDVATETDAWPIVSSVRDHYLVPWPGGRVAAGATREAGSGFVPHTTAGGVQQVLDEALGVAPGLGDARLEEVRVGLRPVCEDGLPVLGPVPGVEGAFLATGHGATGLMLGPYSGKLVAQQVRGEQPSTDVEQFGVGRFC